MFGSGDFTPQYSFLGVLIAVIILIICFTLLTIYFIVPTIKRRARGFNVRGTLKKLDKSHYKVIKKLYFEDSRRKVFTSNVIVSNFGIFIFNAHDEPGTISRNAKGRLMVKKNDGSVHSLGDYEEENLTAINKIKNLSRECAETECFSMVVFPDVTKIECAGNADFFGSIKDALAFIRSKNNDMGDEKYAEVYSALCKENSKNIR